MRGGNAASLHTREINTSQSETYMTIYKPQFREYERGNATFSHTREINTSQKRMKRVWQNKRMKKCGIPLYKKCKHNSKENERDMTGYELAGKKKNAAFSHTRDANTSERIRVKKRKAVRLSSHHYELCESRTAYKGWKRVSHLMCESSSSFVVSA